jgi:putative oxidoreductase
MPTPVQGLFSVVGRVMLSTIFFMSAVGQKIPHFDQVVSYMQSAGVPSPRVLLPGAIAFLIVGSISVIFGFKARFGAALLLVFLALASYYFHPFWKLEGQAQQNEMIQFMKNLSMAGAMVFIIGNGSGKWSLDNWLASKKSA